MFRAFPPSDTLKPYVSHYYSIKCHRENYRNKISEFGLPSGFSHMGFHAAGSFYILQKNTRISLPRFYIAGQQTQNYFINSDSEFAEVYGVTFTPTGMWHLLHLDMSVVTDNAIPSSGFFEGMFDLFKEQYDLVTNPEKKWYLIEDLLLKKLLKADAQFNVIDTAIDNINKVLGCCTTAEIINGLKINERYLQKNFKKMVGITPSIYCRIQRFNSIFSDLKNDKTVNHKALSALYNYYDLPHFSKDFKKYSGECPTKFQLDKFQFFTEVLESMVLSATG